MLPWKKHIKICLLRLLWVFLLINVQYPHKTTPKQNRLPTYVFQVFSSADRPPFLHRMKSLSKAEYVLMHLLSLWLWSTGWTWRWVSLHLCTARTAQRPQTAHGAGNSLLDTVRDRWVQKREVRPYLDTKSRISCLTGLKRWRKWWLRRMASKIEHDWYWKKVPGKWEMACWIALLPNDHLCAMNLQEMLSVWTLMTDQTLY